MSDFWKRQIWLELEKLDRSAELPSLGILEESADPKKERIVSKGSEDRIEVLTKSPENKANHGEEFKPSWILVANLLNRVKKTMVEIRSLNESSQGRFKDLPFGQEFYRRMRGHVDTSETELDCFLEYLRIKSPLQQTNMVHVILEEAVEKHKKRLMDKGIKIFRKQYEKDLPEARVHVEELRFILNWVLEYTLLSAVPNGSIELLTKSLEVLEGKNEGKRIQQNGTKCVEIVIVLGGYEKPNKQMGAPPKINTAHQEGERNCMLPLLSEIVQEKGGLLKFSADSEGRLGMISLILPVERRKVLYYQSTAM